MGLTLEFRAGNKSRIAQAVQECDFDLLENSNVTKFKVDLSLHITPHDLDLLSEAIGEASSVEALPLGDYLAGIVDEPEYGALAVAPEWVKYIAGADAKLVDRISEKFVEKMRTAYPKEQIQPTDAMIKAIGALLDFCKRAKSEKSDVVHVWFL